MVSNYYNGRLIYYALQIYIRSYMSHNKKQYYNTILIQLSTNKQIHIFSFSITIAQ